MDKVNIDPKYQMGVITEIDKLDRKSKEEVNTELLGMGLEQIKIDHLFEHLDITKPTEFLEKVIKYSLDMGIPKEILKYESRLARGLDYYTSTIFEVKIDGFTSGSVLGGGRYDKLIESLSGINIPAVGFGLGFDRTLEAMEQFKLLPDFQLINNVLVSIFNESLLDESQLVTANLRQNGVVTELYPDSNTKLDKQLKYADKKGFTWFIVIGPDEVKKNCIVLKNLITGQQQDVKLENLVEKLHDRQPFNS